jgi:hypothetical protein
VQGILGAPLRTSVLLEASSLEDAVRRVHAALLG